jgi:hypothetical protein
MNNGCELVSLQSEKEVRPIVSGWLEGGGSDEPRLGKFGSLQSFHGGSVGNQNEYITPLPKIFYAWYLDTTKVS